MSETTEARVFEAEREAKHYKTLWESSCRNFDTQTNTSEIYRDLFNKIVVERDALRARLEALHVVAR